MASSDENNGPNKVATLAELYENRCKPIPAAKRFRYVNGRVTYTYVDENSFSKTNSNSTTDSKSNDLHSENSDLEVTDGKEQSESESNSELELLSKPECIALECIAYVNQVNRCITYLLDFKEELEKEFIGDPELMKTLSNMFRDVQILKSAYQIILETIARLKSAETGSFYLYEFLLDPVVSNIVKMYKPFLTQYAVNAKWMGDFSRDNQGCLDACERARKKYGIMSNMNMDNCLYTVFNSLFSLELMFDRYRKCFEENSEQYQKADEAKNLITQLLSAINMNQDQESFLQTQKELNLLTGRSKELKVNTRFIYKGVATKYARRDDKPMLRHLVLFSDCLYVTLLPGNILGTSSVRQELSIESMKVSEIQEDDIPNMSTLRYGLGIDAKEAVQDFYFENEQMMKTWRDKIRFAVKEEIINNKGDYISRRPTLNIVINNSLVSLGSKAPRWQKDGATSFCNGHHCSLKFSAAIRRHHCRADGLLYCDTCCNYKVKLDFDRCDESRVCELCYNILFAHTNNPKQLEEAREQLDGVIMKKTHTGKKTGWLFVRKYNKDKSTFLPEVNYYCKLDLKDPILKFYEKHEDKCHNELIMLLGMQIKTSKDVSRYYKTLSMKQFIIEHNDKIEVYLLKAPNHEECERWAECLKERIQSSYNN